MQTIRLTRHHRLSSGLLILFCCLSLFWLDHETKSVADLVKPGNLAALLVYFLPAFLLSNFLLHLFNQINSRYSFALAHFIGIPAGFALVIFVLSWQMGRL